MTLAMAIDVPVCAIAPPRTVPFEKRLRSSMGEALRRSCRTKATPAATAPRIDASVGTESQPCSTPLVSEKQARPIVATLSTAPGRSSASSVRSSGRSAATPLSEGLAKRYGHRIACLVGAALLAGGLAGLSWGVEHGYLAIAVSMVLMTIGLRTVMTICAVALVDAMPANRTSIGAALNDTAQEVGTSVGTAIVGTLVAVLVTTSLPVGTWSESLVTSFFHGERITYGVLAIVVGLVAGYGAFTLTDSRSTEEPV